MMALWSWSRCKSFCNKKCFRKAFLKDHLFRSLPGSLLSWRHKGESKDDASDSDAIIFETTKVVFPARTKKKTRKKKSCRRNNSERQAEEAETKTNPVFHQTKPIMLFKQDIMFLGIFEAEAVELTALMLPLLRYSSTRYVEQQNENVYSTFYHFSACLPSLLTSMCTITCFVLRGIKVLLLCWKRHNSQYKWRHLT